MASPPELALPPGRFLTVEPLPVSASVMTLVLMILVMPWTETVVAVVVITCYDICWLLFEPADDCVNDESICCEFALPPTWALEPLSGGVMLFL